MDDDENVKKEQSKQLGEKHMSNIKMISTMQELEKHQFNNLQKLNSQNDPDGNQKKIISPESPTSGIILRIINQ